MRRTSLKLLAPCFLLSVVLAVGCGSSSEPASAPTLDPVTIVVVESIGVSDSPQGPPPVPTVVERPIVPPEPGQGLPPVPINLVEAIRVADTPDRVAGAPANVVEPAAEGDSPHQLPPVPISVVESIGVADSPLGPSLAPVDPVHTTEGKKIPQGLPPVSIVVVETVVVGDSTGGVPPASAKEAEPPIAANSVQRQSTRSPHPLNSFRTRRGPQSTPSGPGTLETSVSLGQSANGQSHSQQAEPSRCLAQAPPLHHKSRWPSTSWSP